MSGMWAEGLEKDDLKLRMKVLNVQACCFLLRRYCYWMENYDRKVSDEILMSCW